MHCQFSGVSQPVFYRCSAPALSFGYRQSDADQFSPARRGCLAVSLQSLKDAGFKAIILDLDNTLRPYRFWDHFFNRRTDVPQGVLRWLEAAKDKGFRLYIISNNVSERNVGEVSEDLGIPAVARAFKPFAFRHLRTAVKAMGVRKEETVLVGDKPFADGWFGRLNGVAVRLVPPLVGNAI